MSTYHTLSIGQRQCLESVVVKGTVNPMEYHHRTIQGLERAGLIRWTPLKSGSFQATPAGKSLVIKFWDEEYE